MMLEEAWREAKQAQEEHANLTQKKGKVGIKPRSFLLWGNTPKQIIP